MRIDAKDVLAQAAPTSVPAPVQSVPVNQIQQPGQPPAQPQQPATQQTNQMNQPAPSSNNLQHTFETENKQPGDKITVIDKTGNLYNVYWAPDAKGILIQDVTLKAVLGKTTRFESWQDAQTALDQHGGWEFYSKLAKKVASTFFSNLVDSITKRIAEVTWLGSQKHSDGAN